LARGGFLSGLEYGFSHRGNNSQSLPSAQFTDDFLDWINRGKSEHTVYYGVKDDKTVYVGRTKQPLEVRCAQHNAMGKDFDWLEPMYTNLTLNQAREIEQYLMEYGPSQLNKINSISPKATFYTAAMY
jgi:hypothetical protein